jgi:hypothetical protein
MAWPTLDNPEYPHCTFFAQIGLDSLPRRFDAAGKSFDFPSFPQMGTLFLFLPLINDALWEETNAVVLYEATDVKGLAERQPPNDMPSIAENDWDAEYLAPDSVSPCGKMLRRQYLDVVPYFSACWRGDEMEYASFSKVGDDEIAALKARCISKVLKDPYELPGSVDDEFERRVVEQTQYSVDTKGLYGKYLERTEEDRYVSTNSCMPFQMFGVGDNLQGAVAKQADKILLFQLGSNFGHALHLGDCAVQIWITPEDLASARFDRVTTTVAMS